MAVPTLTALDVTAGPLAGGTTVHITGTNFTGTTGATVGGTAATGVVVVDNTHLTIVTPAKTAGAQTIVVTNASGPSTVNLSFLYVAAPTVTAVSDNTLNIAGSDDVILTGTDLGTVTSVLFGATPATSFTITDATHIRSIAPAHAAGATNITVVNPGGTSATGGGNAVTYAVEAVDTYTEAVGSETNVTSYFMDEEISPAALKAGTLQQRFDTFKYPQVGVVQAAKQGTAGSPNTAPVIDKQA